MHNFDVLVDRTGTGAAKWAGRTEAEKQAGIIPMSVADMEFQVPECVRKAVIQAAEHGIYGYTDSDERYFSALKGWMATRHDWAVEDEDVVCIHGVVPAVAMCVRAYTEEGDGVIIQSPVYPPFFSMVENNKRRVVTNPLINEDGYYRMDYEDLEQKAADPRNKLLVLCSPHNPVGRVWKMEELEKLHEICRRNGVMVVSDEIHFDLIPNGKHIVYAKVDPDAVILTAPSKTFNVPGLRLSNAIIRNPERREAFRAALDACGGGGVTYFGHAAMIAAYEEGAQWLDEAMAYVRGNYLMLSEFFAERFPQVRISPQEGTYLAWVDYRPLGVEKEAMEKFLREKAGWLIGGGRAFGEEGEGFVRINIALPRPELKKALERLSAAAKKMGY